VRLSCARLNDGGSGSFVSPHGLLLTNHHVARGQLQKSSTAEHDYIKNGFYAATPEQEMTPMTPAAARPSAVEMSWINRAARRLEEYSPGRKPWVPAGTRKP